MKIKNLLNTVLIIGAGIFFSRCEIINPSEGIPAYIQIDEIAVEPTEGVITGTLSSNITQVRITVPDPTSGQSEIIGTFSLPATIPILKEGEFDIEIDPIIKANGNSFFLELYPFYQKIITKTTLVPGEVKVLTLATKYQEAIEIEFEENFEDGEPHFFTRNLEASSDNEIIAFEDGAFEGKSGRIQLDTANAGFIISTEIPVEMDLNETGAVYMEVNYKNDVIIEFGIFGVDAFGEDDPFWEFILFEKDDWNKVYLNLTEGIQFLNDNRFRFAIRGIIPFDPTAGQFELETAEVLLDNIKIIHF